MTDSEIERIAKLEVKIEHLTHAMDDMSGKVSILVEMLNQAKGARWAILGVSGLAGFLSGKAGGLLTGFLGK